MIPFKPQYNNPTEVVNIHNFLDNKDISQIASDIKNISYMKGGLGDNLDNPEGNFEDQIRNSKIKWIPMEDSRFHWLYGKITDKIHQLNSEVWKFDLQETIEQIQYTEYDGNVKGHYNWHLDVGKYIASHRKISVTVQICDPKDYEGGELEIHSGTDSELVIEKSLGLMTVFPSFLLHRVRPVTKGKRRSLVLWTGGCAFK